MQPTPNPLDNLSVAAPCSENWAEMSGDDRARFCKLCTKHVYNLSAMSRAEAEALIISKEGKLCIRFAQRADGTVISDNCPVGLRAARDRMRWVGAGIAAALAFACSVVAAAVGDVTSAHSLKAWFVEPPKSTLPAGAMGGCGYIPRAPAGTPTPVVANPSKAQPS